MNHPNAFGLILRSEGLTKTKEEIMKQKRKGPTDPLERAIWLRESVIRRAEQHIRRIYAYADEEAARIRKEIASKKVLLDALKRGKIKP